MNKSEILEKLNEIFRDIFDDDNIQISENTTAADIEDWNSLAQINIIIACQAEFDVKFDLKDVLSLNNIKDITDVIERKLPNDR